MDFAVRTISGNNMATFISKLKATPKVVWTEETKEMIVEKYLALIQDKFFQQVLPGMGVHSSEDYWKKYCDSVNKRKLRGEIEYLEIDDNRVRTGTGELSVAVTSIEQLVEMSKSVSCEVSINDNTLWIHDTRRTCER